MPFGMPQPLPSAPLREALERLGLPAKRHGRASLRTLIHLCTGEPPPVGIGVDELAKALLWMASAGMKEGLH
jgi:hypothetical protein